MGDKPGTHQGKGRHGGRQIRRCHFAILGGILVSSNSDSKAEGFAADISRLKNLYGVEEDQALAKALGSTKAGIASWRRRSALPAWVLAKVAAEFPGALRGLPYDEWRKWSSLSVVYAVALAIVQDNPLPTWAFRDDPHDPQNLMLHGQIFADLVTILQAHIQRKLADLAGEEGDTIVRRCLDDFAAGDIPGADRAIFRRPHEARQ